MSPLRSLRVRLVLWAVALEALLLLVFAMVLVVILRNTQNQQIEETLRLSATQLNAVVDISNNGFHAPAAETADLPARGVFAWVLTSQGRVGLTVGEANNRLLPNPLPSLEQIVDTTLDNGELVRLLATPLQEGSRTSLLTDISSEMLINLLPLFLANVLGVRTSVIGLIEGVAETTASLVKLFSGLLSDRLKKRKRLAVLAGLLWQGLGAWSGFGPAAPFLFGAGMALLAAGLFKQLNSTVTPN